MSKSFPLNLVQQLFFILFKLNDFVATARNGEIFGLMCHALTTIKSQLNQINSTSEKKTIIALTQNMNKKKQ